jgi:hypothetical protein
MHSHVLKEVGMGVGAALPCGRRRGHHIVKLFLISNKNIQKKSHLPNDISRRLGPVPGIRGYRDWL